jgi:predicted phage terminase large subunit-like protein
MSTRLNDESTGAYVIIMQRQHEGDLTGHVLESQEPYVHLCLPHLYESDHPTPTRTCVDFKDPRTKEGEPLYPARFPDTSLRSLEQRMGRYSWAGQGQQRPTPKGGGLIDVAMIGIVDALPAECDTDWRGWDLAATDEEVGKQASYTAGVRIRRTGGKFYIPHAMWFKKTPKEVERRIKQRAALDGYATSVTVEQEPGSGGKNTIEDYSSRVLAGYTFEKSSATGSKWERARGFIAAVEAGNVSMLRGDWNEKFLDHLSRFGQGAKSTDVGDAAAHAFNKARTEPEFAGLI